MRSLNSCPLSTYLAPIFADSSLMELLSVLPFSTFCSHFTSLHFTVIFVHAIFFLILVTTTVRDRARNTELRSRTKMRIGMLTRNSDPRQVSWFGVSMTVYAFKCTVRLFGAAGVALVALNIVGWAVVFIYTSI